jgi:hypothetical protein
LSTTLIREHLEGKITVGLYAINPATQQCKWVAIDADYEDALEDLLKLQTELLKDGIEAALEKSRRGGHLWILAEQPLLARDCRFYIQSLAMGLNVRVKGAGGPEGIEVFPKHDSLKPGEFGNAIRAPLGVHRASMQRYYFYGADYTLQAQMAYLKELKKLSQQRLTSLIGGITLPEGRPEGCLKVPVPRGPRTGPYFKILEHVGPVRKGGRNYWTECPSCALQGKDRDGDNLAIAVDEPCKYKCWAGCTREMIREALGLPIQTR